MTGDNKALVLQATDIVELISQSVSLRRAGKDFIGLCPFHQEKTPSFHVSVARQFYYCFGCKEHGNAIDFVIKRDRVEFREALDILARRAGIELVQTGSKQKPGERQGLLEAHSAACRFFDNLLSQEDGRPAREYLAKRGFTVETLKKFQVGLAADSWDALAKGPVGRKFGTELLATAGLVKPRTNDQGEVVSYYDTFRKRIMFPIRDEGGRIIAFGGRVAPGSDDPAKYLNSPETPLFSKSRCIYGLDLARQRVVETRTVAVVEGYTDVMMAHQFGVSNVVSVLGTAMTEQHVGILRRYADRIVLLFDADAAGDSAVARLVQLFLTQPVEIKVAAIPQGMDPDEFLLEKGAGEFEKVLADAADALSYAWKQLYKQYSAATDITGQQKAAAQYLEMLAGARGSGPIDVLRWGEALARVSRLTEIPVEQLHRRFKGTRRQGDKGTRGQGAEGAQTGGVDGSAGASPSPAGASASQSAPPVSDGLPTALASVERWILGALLMEPGRWQATQTQIAASDFEDDTRRRLAQAYWDHQRDEGEPVFSEFLAALNDSSLSQLAIELVEEVQRLPDVNVALDEALKHLEQIRRKREEQKALAEARRSGDLAAFTKVIENARRPDMRRVGP